jgi:hypothetical protein
MSFIKSVYNLVSVRSKANVLDRMSVAIRFSSDADRLRFVDEVRNETQESMPYLIGDNDVVHALGINFEFTSPQHDINSLELSGAVILPRRGSPLTNFTEEELVRELARRTVNRLIRSI